CWISSSRRSRSTSAKPQSWFNVQESTGRYPEPSLLITCVVTSVRRLRDQNVGETVPWVSLHSCPELQFRSQGTSHQRSGLSPIFEGAQSKVSSGMQRSETANVTCAGALANRLSLRSP